jgi:hypothetical protein
MRLHLPALFTLDGAGRMLAMNVPGGGAAPRFFLGRTARGCVWAVRHDVDPLTADRLAEVAQSEPDALPDGPVPDEDTPYMGLLSRIAPVSRIWRGPAYRFPETLPEADGVVNVTPANAPVLSRWLPDWLPDVSPAVPMVAVLEDGAAVSVCASVRITGAAHEAGVDTHPRFRGRGLAGRVTAAWAARVRDSGAVPLYSTSWENEASRSVATRLGLIHYGSTVHIT